MRSAAIRLLRCACLWRFGAPAAVLALSFATAWASTDLSPWKRLPPLHLATRQIDGVTWTEGMSATSAGRFADNTFNGLLTESVNDYWFYTSSPRQLFDWVVPGTQDEPVAQQVRVDWAHAKWTRRYASGTEFTYLYSCLTPGFLFSTNASRMALQARGGPWDEGEPIPAVRGRAPVAILIPDANGGINVISRSTDPQWNRPQTINRLPEPWVLAIYPRLPDDEDPIWREYFRSDTAIGVLLTFGRRDISLRWWAGQLTIRAPGALGTVGVTAAFEGLLRDAGGKQWAPAPTAARARQLARMLHTYPLKCREWYARDGDWMRIRNEFTYHRWGDPTWQAPDYAPVPPLYAWGGQALGWPAFPAATNTGILTAFGPYLTYPGSVATYRLPIWRGEYASFPRTPELPDVRDSLRSSMAGYFRGLRDKAPRITAWGPVYDPGIAASFGGFNLVDATDRQLMTEVAAEVVRRSWSPEKWQRRAERYTGLEYYGGSIIAEDPSDPFGVIIDDNSALGSALYGTYVYAKFSGDWQLVRRLMPRMWDATRQFEVLNDWAAPQTTCRTNVRFSSMDMDTIALCGLFGLERMSALAGTRAQADRAAYLLAKIAPVTLLRFTTPRYMDPAGMEPRLFSDGFDEEGPMIAIARDDAALKDHLAMTFSWCGQQAEIYHYYLAATGADYWAKWHRGFISTPEFNWYEPRINPDRLYSHVAMRTWLDFYGAWPDAGLAADFDNARRKAGTGAFTAEAVALYLGRSAPAYITTWEPARLLGAEYDPARRTLKARFEATKPGRVLLRLRSAPVDVTVNGTPVQTQPIIETLPLPRPELGGLIAVPIPPGIAEVVARW